MWRLNLAILIRRPRKALQRALEALENKMDEIIEIIKGGLLGILMIILLLGGGILFVHGLIEKNPRTSITGIILLIILLVIMLSVSPWAA